MKNKILLITIFLSIAFIFSPESFVNARPGGGHSYSSSRSSSSSSYSSSSSRSYSSHSSSRSYSSSGKSISETPSDTDSLVWKIVYFFLIFGAGVIFWYIAIGVPMFFIEDLLFKNFKITELIFKILTIASIIFSVGVLLMMFFKDLNYLNAGFLSAAPLGVLISKSAISGEYLKKVLGPLYKKLDTLKAIETTIKGIQEEDPNFSEPAFLDFVSSLYVKYYKYKSDKNKYAPLLKPFVDDDIMTKWKTENEVEQIREIVIGSISIVPKKGSYPLRLEAKIKSNYTIDDVDGKEYRVYATEIWSFMRDNPLSLEPEKMRDLQCPVCGAPADFNDAGICNHCGSTIKAGEHQWALTSINVVEQSREKVSDGLVSYAEDIGYQSPTVVPENINDRTYKFADKYMIGWQKYFNNFQQQKLIPMFNEIYSAWTEMKWLKARHLMSDRLWESWNFWIETYKQNNLRNVLEDAKIDKVELANLTMDKFYDILTVRIFASVKDYTVNLETGKMLGGSKKRKQFSEYWTFVRYSGIENQHDIHHCPNCGAPADKIGQSGICEYCGTKITTGQFGWILFRVVQDEEYPG